MNFNPELDTYTGVATTYPVASAGIALADAAANTYGAYSEVIAAAAVTQAFRISSVTLHTPVGVHVGKVEIASGAGGAEVPLLEIPYEVASDAGGFLTIDVLGMGGVVAANARIAARVKSVVGGLGAGTISVLVGVAVR